MNSQMRLVRLKCLLSCAISMCSWMPFFAMAEILPGNKIPEALKDIKQAGGTCARDDLKAKGTTQIEVDSPPADLTCAMTAPEMLAILKRPETVVVDTRNTSEYSEFQIEGSMNLPVSGLRHKAYLRDKALVLVGTGKAERMLYEACASLKKNGFKQVHVLRGGLAAWLSYAQPIAGRPPSVSSLVQLAPTELWAESQFDANLVLISSQQAALQNQLPYAIRIPQDSKEAIKATLERRQKELKKELKKGGRDHALASIVLVTGNLTSTEQLADLRQALKPIPLLVYSDTVENYTRYLATQKAIWAAQAQGPKQPKCGL